ncbi:DUF5719 family protein [Leucobacter sp. GX24907]
MTDRKRLLRGGARAVTGLLITATAATAAVMVAVLPLPTVQAEAPSITVTTEQDARRVLVCAGSFAELGADPDDPSLAVPTGSAEVTRAGASDDTEELARENAGSGSLPTVQVASPGEPSAAAQRQTVSTEEARGVTASICAEPVNEQWLVGGDTTTGVSTTLSLGNPGQLPATAQITLYDENGQVESSQTAGVLVPPGIERTVSLNGYAPNRERLAVRVVTTGATVTASLGVGQVKDITPVGADTVSRQLDPEQTLVFAGLTNRNDHDDQTASDVGDVDEFPVRARLLAPGDQAGTAVVRAIGADGKSTELGTVDLEPGVVSDLRVEHWPERATALVVDSNVPVVGGAFGSANADDKHDNAWFAPAPVIEADASTAAPVVDGGTLVVMNPGEETATVTVERADGKGKPAEVTVEPGAARGVKAPAGALITSDRPVHAGVRVATADTVAGYPILPLADREVDLTVFPR